MLKNNFRFDKNLTYIILGLAFFAFLFAGFYEPRVLLKIFFTILGIPIYIFSSLNPLESSYAYCDDYLHSFQSLPSFPSCDPAPHKCPTFPRSYAVNAWITYDYYSSLCECYSVHILEKPEHYIDAFGKLVEDKEAIIFNKNRASELQFCLEEKKFWSHISDQVSESNEIQGKINAEYARAVRSQTWIYWFSLGAMILIVIFVMIIVI